MTGLKSRYYFSGFAFVLNRDDIYAYYHSLRMKPVYLTKEISDKLQKLSNHDKNNGLDYIELNDNDSSQLKDTISILLDNKILSTAADTDNKVLPVFQRAIKPPYVKTAFFLVTDHCNFGCKYCYLEKEIEQRGEENSHMTIETAIQSVRFFARLTRLNNERFDEEKQIVFYGGEPLMNFTVVEAIINEIHDLQNKKLLTTNVKLNMISNGSLVTKDIARKLKEYNIGLSISIDGDEESTNNSRCYANGRPVYNDIRKAMDICKQEELPFGLSVTLTEASLNNPQSTADIVFDTGAVSLGLNPILKTNDDINIPDGYAEKAADFIIDSYTKYREKGISEDRMMRKAIAFAHSKVYPFDCNAAGGNQIIVNPSGKVGICQGLMYTGKYIVTDVWDETFDPAKDDTYIEWAKRSPLNIKECESCIALGICGGGCPFVAEYKEGSIWDIDRQFCVHARKTLEWLIFDLFDKDNSSK